MPRTAPDDAREIYFEFTSVGGVLKVAAIDGQTGIEVAVIGPACASQGDLERLALQKLNARLARKT
jgi:hypothetical protein